MVASTVSTKFFTNQDENTLLDKIKGIFTHRNIHFFDALVGYFYASGYFRVRSYIERAAEVRVLVGINVDKMVYEASKQGVLFTADAWKSQEDFFESVKNNIQQAKYSKIVEDGMLGMIDDIVSGKLQIRVHPKQNIHAKVYIFREQIRHNHGYGSVITGSSNLTEPGLERNFEFNVELRENGDIDFATDTFEQFWHESVPVAEEFIARLKKETFLNDQFTPYEVYLKFLIECFGKSIDYDPNSETDLPNGWTSRAKRSKGRCLLDRLMLHQEAVLAFAFEPGVPFTNNQAERDLRPVKVKQRASGCFRTESGASIYARIAGFISTMRKNGRNVVDELASVLSGSFQWAT